MGQPAMVQATNFLLVSDGFSSWLLIMQEKTKTPNWLRNSPHGSKVIKKEKWQTYQKNIHHQNCQLAYKCEREFCFIPLARSQILFNFWTCCIILNHTHKISTTNLAPTNGDWPGTYAISPAIPSGSSSACACQVSGCKLVDTVGNSHIWKGSGLALGSHQKYLHLPFLQLMLLSNLAIHQTSQIGEGHQRQRKWSLGT